MRKKVSPSHFYYIGRHIHLQPVIQSAFGMALRLQPFITSRLKVLPDMVIWVYIRFL